MARKLACLLVVLLAGSSAFATDWGAIAGTVKDNAGTPQTGAVVEIFTSASVLGAIVFTDSRGFYSAENLPPGTYTVKVSAVSFLPAFKDNVGLRAGTRVLINITLNSMASVAQSLPARRSTTTDPDDWHWVLRSSANRPVLRAVDHENDASSPVSASGEQAEDRSLKARVAFVAGSEAEGFGSAGDMTTAFALEKSLFGSGTFSFDGNIGASTGEPAGVLRASYAHDFGTSQHPVFAVIYRRFAAPGTFLGSSPSAAIEMNTSDRMAVGDFIDLQYGAAIQSLEFAKRITALRPYGAVSLHLTPTMVVEYRYATSEPNTRAAKGFDTAPADLSESGPRMALSGGEPEIERAQHQEISVSRRFGKTNLQVACYLDHVRNAVLTGAGDPSGYSDDVLPDVYSGTFSYAYAGTLNTSGTRVVLERKIIDELAATVDYATGGAVSAESMPGTWQNLAQSLVTRRQQSLGAKLAGRIPASGTRWIASYKWTSGNTVSVVDAFNASPGQTDPYLSFFIRQPLPATSLIPAKMDALIDVRNLLAQGYLPVMGPDGRLVYLVQSARSLRGGVAFTF
jgi:hypothetical protein